MKDNYQTMITIRLVKIIKNLFVNETLKIVFDTNDLIKKIAKSDSYFHTFLNNENLAAGILCLRPGEEDTQEPHDSDEMYYVIRGDGYIRISDKDYPVSEGLSYFVSKKTLHKFHGNRKELVVLYFFGGPDF